MAFRRELERLRADVLYHATHRNMPLPRQRLALQCGVFAGLVSIAVSAPLLVCLGATLTAVGLVLRYSTRPANRLDWMLSLIDSLDIPVGGYMEVYRDPAILAHPYPEDALVHCAAQELMLIQQLLEKKSAPTAFPA
ncbi:hypothetical protein FZO59_20810 [Lelliottia nimipressuralis]|uniref:DUF4231 domain-containing protein n=2 Tax=Lelliottia nimipressuralis TaxID=69220 RepID=A0ABY3NXI7_9ENTR|nr:hypothetical protein [Lelliottia nimipressuralis]RXJ10735.1 hypothetical protein ETG88_19525 [Lelliottia nimipressuralis]TYT29237.1 hypothetical protein FZO59_20810 [Lelliottia nimipressuralis]